MRQSNVKSKKIMLVAILNIIIVILELVFGFISNSLALVTDALHNLGDVLALFVALTASYYALKSATSKMTFGYIRAEMMAAFLNSLFLCITMVYVLYEAVLRFMDPVLMDAKSVMIVASIALVVNGISAYLLRDNHDLHSHEHYHKDLNIKAAYLHMLGDAVISLGVVLGAVMTLYFQVLYIDPLMTFIFGAYILKSSFEVLRESFFSLIDANPNGTKEYEELLLSFEEICSVHDIHLTLPSSKDKYFSAHIVLKSNKSLEEIEHLIEKIRCTIKQNFGVTHVLIQPETTKYKDSLNYCISH